MRPGLELKQAGSGAKKAPTPPALRRYSVQWLEIGNPFPFAAYLRHDLEANIEVNFQ